jgi:hypothetical protein
MLNHNLKKILYIFCISIVCLFFSISSLAQQENWPKSLCIGTGSVGGGMYMGGSALSKVINDMIPGLNSTVEITGAAEANVALIKAKEIDIGMSTSTTSWESFNAKGYAEGKPEKVNKDIRALFNGWPNVFMFVTLEKYGINKLSDFEGKVVSVYTKGSNNNTVAERILGTLGININPVYLNATDSAMSLKDGVISGFILGWPNTEVIQLEAEHKVVIITPNDEEIKKVMDVYPQYLELTIPGGAYKTVPEPRAGLGSFTGIVCHKDLPTDLIYTIVSAMYDNMDIVKSIWPTLANNMEIEDLLKYSTIPLHTGVIKYVREQGFSIPEKLIPSEAK